MRTGFSEAQHQEALADRLRESEIITSAGHYVEAARLYAIHAMKARDAEAWEGAERCTRAAAAALDRCADFFSQQREGATRSH